MKKEDYRFGIVRREDGVNTGICNCGNVMTGANSFKSKFDCDKCGNNFFIPTHNFLGERFSVPYLESERRDNRGFKVKRVNLSIHYKDKVITPIKENLTRTVDFDMVDKRLQVWRGKELEYDYVNTYHPEVRSRVNTQLFSMLSQNLFLDFVSNDVTRDLFHLTKTLGYRGNGKDDLMVGFEKLLNPDNAYLQILANAGLPQVHRFRTDFKNSRYYNNPNANTIKKDKTKPHEILGLPKFMMAYLREDDSVTLSDITTLQNAFKKIDTGKFKDIMSVIKDESNIDELTTCLDEIIQIHMDYGYDNLKKLILYLFREIRLYQGINSPEHGATLLRDYIRMSRTMNLEWEKYPRSLKKEHDIVQMNYEMLNQNEDSKRRFNLSIEKESYKVLAYENKKENYNIVLPVEGKDLIKEGNQLSHCVSSYVTDIMDDKCKIVFLRDKENVEKPLVTIEVRGFNIRQAKRFGNNPVTHEQKEFIKKWAEEKTLIEAYY